MARKQPKIEIDKKALTKVVREIAPQPLSATANRIVRNLRSELDDDIPVVAHEGINRKGRPYILVGIAHPSGIGLQAKHGTLTRAAAEAGIQTRRTDEGG